MGEKTNINFLGSLLLDSDPYLHIPYNDYNDKNSCRNFFLASRNLGLDLIVVVTKTDFMADLEKDFDYKDEHFDFIQQAVRDFILGP